MKEHILQNPSQKGYLLIPRSLFKEFLNNRAAREVCKVEAFMIMLYMVHHTDYKKKNYLLKRGESDLKVEQWASLFGWGKWKVRYFFHQLQEQQQITYTTYGKTRVMHISNYELFCGNQTKNSNNPEEQPMNKTERMFIEFWESYHELTGMEPCEREAARRIWKRLPLPEKQMAITNIYDYVMRIELRKDLKRAYRYLLDKEFR